MKSGVYVGDCVELLTRVEDESVDLILFSPPYDNIRTYKNSPPFDRKALGRELFRVAKTGAVCVVVIGDATNDFAKSLTSFRWPVEWCDEIGWRLFETTIYNREGRPGAWWNKRFRVDHEYVHIFLKGPRPKFFTKEHLKIPCKYAGAERVMWDRLTTGETRKGNPLTVSDTKCRGTVWAYSKSNSEGNKKKLEHPATFPDALARDVIRCFSVKDDIVLDPMMGSGTTCVIAAQEGRRYVGIDIADEYVNIAYDRLAVEARAA